MKKIIIYGITDMAEYVSYFINRDSKVDIVAYTVEKKYKDKDKILNCEVVEFENIEDIYPPSEYELFIAIGPTEMNKVRERYFVLAKEKGYTLYTYISNHAIVSSSLGENNFIGDFSVINPNVQFGNNNIMYEHCVIASNASIGNSCYVAPRAIVGSHAKVLNNIILGMNSVVNTEVIVANESLIGAQVYVSKDTIFKGVYGQKSTPLIACISDKVSFKMI